MISMPTDSGLRRTIDIAANAQGVALNHSIVTNQFGSLFDFVANGLGISIVPATALPGSNEHRIVARKLRPALTRQIGILRLPERPLSSAAVAFLNVFRPKFFSATARPLGRAQKR
jgi:LysR family carnitine catabolism transcriptional activator